MGVYLKSLSLAHSEEMFVGPLLPSGYQQCTGFGSGILVETALLHFRNQTKEHKLYSGQKNTSQALRLFDLSGIEGNALADV